MGKEAKEGIGKLKAGLVISAIVIVVLAGLSIWFYNERHSLGLQIGELWDNYGSEQYWHSYYQNMSNQLSSEKANLQSTYDDYVATHSHTNTEYDNYVATHGYTSSEYEALQSTYNTYVVTHSHTDTEYATLNTTYQNYMSTHTHTDSEYNELLAIANLQKSQLVIDEETIPQSAGARTLVETFTASYSGYVTVSITSSTTNAYIDVEFTFKGQFFKFTKTLGTSGSAMFCVLPATVYIYVGNSNLLNPATHTISATYWY